MPVTMDTPIQKLRKDLVNKKPAHKKSDAPNKSKPTSTKAIPGVIPSKDFGAAIKRATELCKELAAERKVMKQQKLTVSTSKYKRLAKELGGLMSSIVNTIKNTASVVTEAQTRAELVANAKLPAAALNAARTVLKQLSGSHRRIKTLNDDIAKEVANASNGLEPKVILNYLPEIKDIYEVANTARKDAAALYSTWSQHINPGSKLERRAERGGITGQPVTPGFHVLPGVVTVGDATNPASKRVLDKITKALNLGSVVFPDPYTILWNYYSDKTIKLDNDVRMIVRYAIMYAAKSKPIPKQHSIIDLYSNGQLLKDSKAGEKFDATDFNENFANVVKMLIRKVKKDPKLQAFVFDHYQRADDTTFNMAMNHLSREDSRGYSLIDNARKHYIEACRNWFTTYLPVV